MENIEHPKVGLARCADRTPQRGVPTKNNHWLLDVPKIILIFVIRIYKLVISPAQTFLFGAGSGCRFTPTCSQYAVEAIRQRGAMAGTILAAKRICRCHPFGSCGHDPIPKTESGKREAENQFVLENSI